MRHDSQERPHTHPELVSPDEPGAASDGSSDAVRDPADASGQGLDLLTIGLVVFFVALIATVGALLILPAILQGPSPESLSATLLAGSLAG